MQSDHTETAAKSGSAAGIGVRVYLRWHRSRCRKPFRSRPGSHQQTIMARLDIGAEKEPVRTNRVSADLWRSSCGRLRMRTRKRSRQCSGQIEDGAGRVWPI